MPYISHIYDMSYICHIFMTVNRAKDSGPKLISYLWYNLSGRPHTDERAKLYACWRPWVHILMLFAHCEASFELKAGLETTQCQITDTWVNRTWYVRTMEYYSDTKGNEVVIHAIMWMCFENIMRNERSQTKYHVSYGSIHMKCPE